VHSSNSSRRTTLRRTVDDLLWTGSVARTMADMDRRLFHLSFGIKDKLQVSALTSSVLVGDACMNDSAGLPFGTILGGDAINSCAMACCIPGCCCACCASTLWLQLGTICVGIRVHSTTTESVQVIFAASATACPPGNCLFDIVATHCCLQLHLQIVHKLICT
jgi:hypothetical protein